METQSQPIVPATDEQIKARLQLEMEKAKTALPPGSRIIAGVDMHFVGGIGESYSPSLTWLRGDICEVSGPVKSFDQALATLLERLKRRIGDPATLREKAARLLAEAEELERRQA